MFSNFSGDAERAHWPEIVQHLKAEFSGEIEWML